MPDELLQHNLWWDGPTWLRQDPINGLHNPCIFQTASPISTPELKTAVCHVVYPVPPEWIEERYSSYRTLLHVNAWMLRFLSNLKAKQSDKPLFHSQSLTPTEIMMSEQHELNRGVPTTVDFRTFNSSIEHSLSSQSLSRRGRSPRCRRPYIQLYPTLFSLSLKDTLRSFPTRIL